MKKYRNNKYKLGVLNLDMLDGEVEFSDDLIDRLKEAIPTNDFNFV